MNGFGLELGMILSQVWADCSEYEGRILRTGSREWETLCIKSKSVERRIQDG